MTYSEYLHMKLKLFQIDSLHLLESSVTSPHEFHELCFMGWLKWRILRVTTDSEHLSSYIFIYSLKKVVALSFFYKPLWRWERPHYSSELNSKDSHCQKDLSWLFTTPGNQLAWFGCKHSEGMLLSFCIKAWPAHSSFLLGLCKFSTDLQVCVRWALSYKK